ncbi:unnamed protein product [Paramecium sonneborni]|uniref:Uncharacterized protein n=1 Tax=Paramecium sonneborni TaxID=65129 RepID=A0A8S1KEF8_9CILI|nr:unnamed protein product [Paramecium sonneborni]
MDIRVPHQLEWKETQFAMNSHKQLIQVKEPFIIKKYGLGFIDQDQKYEGKITIDNKKDHDFQNELKKMTDLNSSKNQLKIQSQKDRKDTSITQISESNIQSLILPREIKQNKLQIQNFGDKKLYLIIKGEGFSEFRIRSIQIKLSCISCKEFLPANHNKFNSDILQFQTDCKKCSQQMSIDFYKNIQQNPENPSIWQIGSIKTYKNVEFQVNFIEVLTICKCLSQSSRIPYLLISFEKKTSQNQRLKCLLTDQIRQLCHGCVQELKFQPEWLIIKQ